MEQEPILEVTDKRRVSAADASVESSSEPAAAVDETGVEMPPMDVYGLLKTTVGLLGNGAWAWMGLSPSPFTGEMNKDLAQAKVAIDTVAFLADQLDPTLADAERREMRNLVTMLRMNYVQQSGR